MVRDWTAICNKANFIAAYFNVQFSRWSNDRSCKLIMKSAMLTNTSTRQRVLIAAAFASSVLGLAQPAHALDFSFSFRGVEGYLTGLVDNSTDQIPLTVVVANTVNGAGVFPYYFWYKFPGTDGFSVVNGDIVAANTGMLFRSVPPSQYPDFTGTYGGQSGPNNGYGYDLWLGDPGASASGPPYNYSFLALSNVGGQGEEDGSNGVITYKAAAVPGPVPILGALAALRCSRTLRKRCRFQASKSVAS
jgi:hypothetical protein